MYIGRRAPTTNRTRASDNTFLRWSHKKRRITSARIQIVNTSHGAHERARVCWGGGGGGGGGGAHVSAQIVNNYSLKWRR